ncbi:MAG: efflux RND transporter periplasmic adaptor subunit [Limnohabitans sp.]
MVQTLIRPLLLAAGLAALAACQDRHEPASPVAQPIIEQQRLHYPADHPQLRLLVTVPAQPAQGLTVELPARIVWNEEKTQRIYPAFAGRVGRILADVGQSVAAGQVLAQLASPEFGAAQADTARALTDARLAQQTLQRQRELFAAGVVARRDLELAEAEAARAQAEAARAQARTSLYGSALAVNQQLGLRSDIAGTVVERNINPGQELRPEHNGAALFIVSDPTRLWVQIDAQEADLRDLRPGSQVALLVPSLEPQVLQATVQAVTDQIDPSTRTIKVRAAVANPARLLKNEMLARARYERQVGGMLEVPASSVFLRGRQHFVFVCSAAGVFEARDVAVFHEGTQRVLLSAGLKAGEQVVSENGLLLERELRLAQQAVHGASAVKP